MPWSDPTLLTIGLLALVLAYVNGLHDASNAVSTAIASRALSERTALGVAAVLNLLGALIGILVAGWSAQRALRVTGLADVDVSHPQIAATVRTVVVAAVVATLVWELLTWWWGMPSSTWHAMFSGIAGASLALGLAVPLTSDALAVLGSLLLSPLLGGVLSFALVHAIARLSRWRAVRTHHLRAAQTVSAGAVAAGHGLHDSLLPMSVIVIALATVPAGSTGTGGALGTSSGATAAGEVLALPVGIGIAVAVAIAAGTLAGGHRVIRTLARRLTDLSTAQGLAAEASAAVVLFTGTIGLGAPISTSHTVTAGIVGSGLAVGPRSVRWSIVRRILATWCATPVVAGLLGAGIALTLAAF